MLRTSLIGHYFNAPVRGNENTRRAEPSTSLFSLTRATTIAVGIFNALGTVRNDINRIGAAALQITNSINSIHQNGMRIIRAGRQTLNTVINVSTFLLQGMRRQVTTNAQPERVDTTIIAIEDQNLINALEDPHTIQEEPLVTSINRIATTVENRANQLQTINRFTSIITNNPIPTTIVGATLSSLTGPIAQRAMQAVAIIIQNTTNPAFQMLSCAMILSAMLHMIGSSIHLPSNANTEEESTWVLLDSEELRLQIAVEDGIVTFMAISGEETLSIHCDTENWNLVDLETRLEDWIHIFTEGTGPQVEELPPEDMGLQIGEVD